MAVFSAIVLGAFDVVVCAVEIPKMLRQKLIKELAVFLILLLLGTTAGIMKIFDLKIPNPTDLLKWASSPAAELMKSILEAD